MCSVIGTGDGMSAGRVELEELGRMVSAERRRRGISLRDAADELGIPFNTLARVEKGHIPDLPKFKRLVEWCGADIRQFFEAQERPASTTDAIAEHLGADRNLPPGAARTYSWNRQRALSGLGTSPRSLGSAFTISDNISSGSGPHLGEDSLRPERSTN